MKRMNFPHRRKLRRDRAENRAKTLKTRELEMARRAPGVEIIKEVK